MVSEHRSHGSKIRGAGATNGGGERISGCGNSDQISKSRSIETHGDGEKSGGGDGEDSSVGPHGEGIAKDGGGGQGGPKRWGQRKAPHRRDFVGFGSVDPEVNNGGSSDVGSAQGGSGVEEDGSARFEGSKTADVWEVFSEGRMAAVPLGSCLEMPIFDGDNPEGWIY